MFKLAPKSSSSDSLGPSESLIGALPVGLLALTLLLGCRDSSSAPGTETLSTFSVQFVSLMDGELQVPLNEPIVVSFDRPIDFDSVSLDTFRIFASPNQVVENPDRPGEALDVSDLPAIGDFVSVDERTVRFQPSCPLQDSFAGGALYPGIEYTLQLPTISDGGVSIVATGSGGVLDEKLELQFRTASGSSPADLYLDPDPNSPQPVVRMAGSGELNSTRLEVGGDTAAPVFLERSSDGEPGEASGFLAPLNLFSSAQTRIDVLVVFDQPVHPGSENISPERIGLEYQLDPARDSWTALPIDVVLERNCGDFGAEVRLIPLSQLPQGRRIRIRVAAELEDLVRVPLGRTRVDIGSFETRVPVDPGTTIPGDAADEIFEAFTFSGTEPGSREDGNTSFAVPPASWNDEGTGVLRPKGFAGTGGPNGEFDVVIPGGVTTTFNTNEQQFFGGPGGLSTYSATATGGVLQVRNLTLQPGAEWRITGPNPVTILATGDVRIEGLLAANGLNAPGLFVLNQPNVPSPGGLGVAGGGVGGTGSPLTNQSSPMGGSGASGITLEIGGGGGGGESGIATISSLNGENRRGGGGGGGVFGPDVLDLSGCPEESYIGLNAEPGQLGNATVSGGATGAVSGQVPPLGGRIGPGPFRDDREDNDFWGTMISTLGGAEGTRGELAGPSAGAGGGAGGDATLYSFGVGYPDPNFPFSREDLGAGGGGGAGSVTILALGTISFGPSGRIEANGGHGAGGENTNFINRVGAGSGGGSGGHVVLQASTAIDFSEVPIPQQGCPQGPERFACLSIVALGGQGGVGAGNGGGFDPSFLVDPDGFSAWNPVTDAKPPRTSASGLPCDDLLRVSAGGDGGPGLVQLHTPRLIDIVPPGGQDGVLRDIMRPGPVGMNEITGEWEGHLIPEFNRFSRARSLWIPLGALQVAPGSATPDPVEYLFRGVDPVTGLVKTTNGEVDPLPAALISVLTPPGSLPQVEDDGLTLVMDITELVGVHDVYRRNPALLRMCSLEVETDVDKVSFDIVEASSDELAGELRMRIAPLENGENLTSFAIGDVVKVRPRFFGISTESMPNSLPDSATVRFRFQAAPENFEGEPDETRASPLTSDIQDLTNSTENTDFRFLRFVVDFDIAANGAPVSSTSPLPSVEFLRIPFRF